MDVRYLSDLTDAEWKVLEPMMPKRKTKRGRPREVSYRELLSGIFYLNKECCQWRALPSEFGSWQTVYHYFRLWNRNGLWQQINDKLVGKLRKLDGRELQPSAAIIDSQSVKTTQKKARVVTMRAKRSRGASDTSSSIRWA
jgi:putative transposase